MMDEKERREKDEWMILCMNELLDEYYAEKTSPRGVVDSLADCLVSAERRMPEEGE
jgi:hypothetical protein